MTRRLAALSLFLTASLAAATTIPIAPRDVVTDTNMGRGRPFVTAATNGSAFIVAWEDRLFPAHDSTASIVARTYGANGGAEQQLLVLVAGSGIGPSVVWSGTDWIVSWRTFIDAQPLRPLAAADGTFLGQGPATPQSCRVTARSCRTSPRATSRRPRRTVTNTRSSTPPATRSKR